MCLWTSSVREKWARKLSSVCYAWAPGIITASCSIIINPKWQISRYHFVVPNGLFCGSSLPSKTKLAFNKSDQRHRRSLMKLNNAGKKSLEICSLFVLAKYWRLNQGNGGTLTNEIRSWDLGRWKGLALSDFMKGHWLKDEKFSTLLLRLCLDDRETISCEAIRFLNSFYFPISDAIANQAFSPCRIKGSKNDFSPLSSPSQQWWPISISSSSFEGSSKGEKLLPLSWAWRVCLIVCSYGGKKCRKFTSPLTFNMTSWLA